MGLIMEVLVVLLATPGDHVDEADDRSDGTIDTNFGAVFRNLLQVGG